MGVGADGLCWTWLSLVVDTSSWMEVGGVALGWLVARWGASGAVGATGGVYLTSCSTCLGDGGE